MPEDVVSGYTTVEEDGVTKYKAGQLLFFLLGGPVFPRNTNFRGTIVHFYATRAGDA